MSYIEIQGYVSTFLTWHKWGLLALETLLGITRSHPHVVKEVAFTSIASSASL